MPLPYWIHREIRRLPSYVGALAIFLAAVGNARAESALNAMGSCREVVNGLRPDGKIFLSPGAQWCWGAFDVLQTFARVLVEGKDDPNQTVLHACVGPKVSRGQMVLVFLKYADNHPAELDQDFTPMAINALIEAFPCK